PIFEGVDAATAVDPTGHAAAGKDEAVAVRTADEVLDAGEGLTVERAGSDAGEGPGVRGVGADQRVVAGAAGNDAADAAARHPLKDVRRSAARQGGTRHSAP